MSSEALYSGAVSCRTRSEEQGINCPHCATVNPDGAKFCFNCGQALAVKCPECGTNLPPSAKFCFNCGHQMGAPVAAPAPAAPPPPAPSPAPPKAAPIESRLQQFIPRELLSKLESARSGGRMEGERRVVTMLFCDVKVSTATASSLDPEEWAEIINGAFDQMIPPIYKYEGSVARLMGDGILAFFGAPIAHEDDPQRAVLAELEILASIRLYREQVQRAWGLEMDVRDRRGHPQTGRSPFRDGKSAAGGSQRQKRTRTTRQLLRRHIPSFENYRLRVYPYA